MQFNLPIKIIFFTLFHWSFKNDEDINLEKKYNQIIEQLKSLNIINSDPVSKSQILMDPAYCHITHKSEQFIKNLFIDLNKNNLYSIGRYGRWTYCSIEDNIIEAKEMAEKDE